VSIGLGFNVPPDKVA